MRVILTGGGSGGHIYPAIAIGDKIKEMEPETEFLYIGNEIGIEKDIVPGTGYPFRMVEARWFERNPSEILKTGIVTLRGSNEALRIMKEFRPDAVIGTGGYACVPVIHAGHRYHARCFLHEQNVYPGVANRFLERYADRVFLGFSAASSYFRQPEKHRVVGNPVRSAFFDVSREEARKRLGVNPGEFMVFTFAGSQGADDMTEVCYHLMKSLNGREGIRMVFVTGTIYYPEVTGRIEEEGLKLEENISVKDYIQDMENYLNAADLVIGRAGALSVAEICVTGTPSVLVPSPNVTGNHQYYNAKEMSDRGAAILIEEKDFTPELAEEEIYRLMNDPEKVRGMGEAALNCAPVDTTGKIYREIKEVLNGEK